jgi:protoheme IX farnesyltransferase
MPHSYGIAMYRLQDYKDAGIPVLPLKQGMRTTKIHSLLYIAAFILAAGALASYGYIGYVSLGILGILGAAWFWRGARSFSTATDEQWGRSIFRFSLLIVVALSGTLSVDTFLR